MDPNMRTKARMMAATIEMEEKFRYADTHSSQHPDLGTAVIVHHGSELCADDERCCFHAPSDHPLADEPFGPIIHGPRGNATIITRRCKHGIDHPDPDSIDWLMNRPGYQRDAIDFVDAHWQHCDDCCQPPLDPMVVDNAVTNLRDILRRTTE